METADVGEGSQAQLVSLQGDSRAGDPGCGGVADKCQEAPISPLTPLTPSLLREGVDTSWGGGMLPAPGTVWK